jgi:hypothetical protein
MTWELAFLLPALLCGLVGYTCGDNARVDIKLGDNTSALKNALASFVCWSGAAVSLAGVVL